MRAILFRGKFGEVKRCRELATGREFAAKFIATPRPQDRKDVEHEISTMRRLHHRRLVQLYDAFESKKEMCLILEMYELFIHHCQGMHA
jgi:myosin-light-chain kinase